MIAETEEANRSWGCITTGFAITTRIADDLVRKIRLACTAAQTYTDTLPRQRDGLTLWGWTTPQTLRHWQPTLQLAGKGARTKDIAPTT